MLRGYPLSALPSYRRWQPLRVITRWLPRLFLAMFAAVAIAVGTLPNATLNDLLRPRPTLTTIIATGIESSALMSLLCVFVSSGMYARDRAVAALLMLRVAARFAAYGLWAVAPLLVNPVAILVRLPLLCIVGRQLLNRTVLYVPRRDHAPLLVNRVASAVTRMLSDHRK